jgi:sugar phosphate permease
MLSMRDRRRSRPIFYGWWNVAISSFSHILSGGLYSTGLSVYFLPISRDLGLTRAALSMAFTLRSLEAGLDGPLTGYLVDRFGPRAMVRIGVVLAGLGFVLLAFTNSYLTFLLVFLGVLAMGFSVGFTHPYMALINQWFQRRRAMALSLAFVGNEVGGAILTPLVGLLVLTVGWRDAAVISGVVLPILILPTTLFIRNTPESMGLRRDGAPPEETPGPGPSAPGVAQTLVEPEDFTVREAMRTRAYWHLVLAMGTRIFGKTAFQVHLVALLVWKGIDERDAVFLVGLFALSQIPTRLGAAWLGDRWSLSRTSALAALAGVGAGAALLLGDHGSMVTGALFVLLFAVAEGGNLTGWAIIGSFFGRRNFATIRGSISLFQSLISLPSPVLAGWVFDRTSSYALAVAPMAGAYLLAALLYWALRQPKRPGAAAP